MIEAPPNALRARLLALMVLRVVLALAFLGITTWFQTREYSYTRFNFYPLYAVVIIVGLLTILYALALKRAMNLRLFAYAQVTADIALVTLIVYVTGGTESYLHVLYPLTVIGASIILNRQGGLYAASASSIAYGVLMDMDLYGMLPLQYKVLESAARPGWQDVFMTVAANILAYFTIAYLTGYLAERTARVEKRLEEKEIDFERLEALNRQIVDNISSGIMTIDGKGRITSFNREAVSVTGFTLKEVYFRSLDSLFPGMIEDAGVERGGRVERKFTKKNGEEGYLGYTVSEGQGGDMDRIIIFQDLTRLKEMEEQLRRDEKLKALGELSVGIAHEIRNPLASISGSIQVLKGDLELKGDDEKLMEIVVRETERLNSLLTDFLLFARPAREKRELVELGSIIGEMVSVFRNSPEASSIKIENNVKDMILISGDPRQLGQVFWNLFVNASHAMEGKGALKVSSRVLSRDETALPGGTGPAEEYVEITVSDTGKGISPEDMKRIFDPFFSTKDRGTGLGLAIVHRIIESHEGTIDVRSEPGAGASFRIVLPLLPESAARSEAAF